MAVGSHISGQFYYKDIIGTEQAGARWRNFQLNRVEAISLQSLEANGQATDGFVCEQKVSQDSRTVDTYSRSTESSATDLVATYNSMGQLIKTLDTSDSYQSTTTYQYDSAGRVLLISNIALETDNQVRDTEDHLWTYDAQGKPQSMLKLKTGHDSTIVRFVLDEKGNVIEEHALHREDSLPVVFYYYDGANRLTDIVRYNRRAGRLLPDYVFEYDAQGRIVSMLEVPEGNDYQRWIYAYNEKGLKASDTCYGKGRILLGKIAYGYRYAK